MTMPAEMSIYALPGHQVQVGPYYLNCGYESEREAAKKHLRPGVIYTVKQTSVGQSHSTVEVEQVPGVHFNTCHFVSLEPQSEEQDKQHPDYIRYFGGLRE